MGYLSGYPVRREREINNLKEVKDAVELHICAMIER